MGAIAVGEEHVAEVDEKVCIGCGVCTPTCEADAVDLTLREEVESPPEISEFLTKRFKWPQTD